MKKSTDVKMTEMVDEIFKSGYGDAFMRYTEDAVKSGRRAMAADCIKVTVISALICGIMEYWRSLTEEHAASDKTEKNTEE